MDDLQTLLRPLVEQPETAPEPVEWIAAQARRRTRRRRGLTVAAATLVVAAPTWLVLRREPAADTTTGPADTASSTTSAPSTTSTTSTTAPPADPFGSAAPWAGAAIPGSAAPNYVEAAASDPDAAAKCPVVAPDDIGEGAGATPRTSAMTSLGGWSVEYDLPGAPGTPEEGALATPDAGRSTFSVGAVVMPAPPPGWDESVGVASVRDLITNRPRTHTWSDGAIAGWGGDLTTAPQPPTTAVVDGHAIDVDDDEVLTDRGTNEVEPPRAWIQFQLQGADPSCLYTVSSYLGEDHAFHLVEHLRRVEGT